MYTTAQQTQPDGGSKTPVEEATSSLQERSKLIEKLKAEKRSAIEFQSRRHQDWNDNYELYRNKVKTNRLTQRQAVNIPLMKETIRTALSKIDDPPIVDWKEKSGDEMKELIYQEIWNDASTRNKFDWIDVVDKKNVLLYGLSSKKLNVSSKGVLVSVLDPFDVLYDPTTDPLDVETARFIIHQNIYKSLRDCLADDRYTKEGKTALAVWSSMERGIIQGGVNKEEMEKKQERLRAMGVDSSDFALFAGGEVIVNITEHFYEKWNKDKKVFERWVAVYADDNILLMDEKLIDLIGVEFWPFTIWGDDPESTDIYPDGVADLVRVPNKIINVWFSQMIENRTLRNFQMHWYDSTVTNYQPQVYEPGPGRMLPAPGKPGETIQPVEISGLEETLTSIDFLTKIVERGSGETAIDKGVSERKQITLGEVNLLVGKSMERARGLAKFYRGSWHELAVKWDALMQANVTEKIHLYKTGRSGKVYEKVVYPADWQSKAGYAPTVSSSSEQDEERMLSLQKLSYVMAQYPSNNALKKISQRRQLEILDLTPQELNSVLEEEARSQEAASAAAEAPTGVPAVGQQGGIGGGEAGSAVPAQPQSADAETQQLLSRLTSLIS